MKRLIKKFVAIVIANILISSNMAYASTIDLKLPNIDNSFKTYMSYKTITDQSSTQWNMQQNATTADNGLRLYEDRYMIAVGTYYAQSCGEKLNIYLDNGHILYCIVGDIKQDIHTDKTNRYVVTNGNIVEFIVDTSVIEPMAKKMGNMSYSANLDGQIIKIEKEV